MFGVWQAWLQHMIHDAGYKKATSLVIEYNGYFCVLNLLSILSLFVQAWETILN